MVNGTLAGQRDSATGCMLLGDTIQQMPEQRVRLNPILVKEISCLLLAFGKQWEQILKRTHRGMDAHARASLRGQKEYANHAISALNVLLACIQDTASLADFEEQVKQWEEIGFWDGSHDPTKYGAPDPHDTL
jgi:hypothetical protein